MPLLCHFLRRTVTFIGSHWGYLQAAQWQWNMSLPWLQKHGLAWLFFPGSAGDKWHLRPQEGTENWDKLLLNLNSINEQNFAPIHDVRLQLCAVCKSFPLCYTHNDACCEWLIFYLNYTFLITSHSLICKHGNTVDFTWINDLKSFQTQTQGHLCENNLFHISEHHVMDHFPTPQNKTSIEPRGFSTPLPSSPFPACQLSVSSLVCETRPISLLYMAALEK